MEMIVYCKKCGHIWDYQGKADNETSCPPCKAYVNLLSQRLDEPLGGTGDYSGSKYLGISIDNVAHYWDSFYNVAICFFPESDRLEEIKPNHQKPMDYMCDVSEAIGWKFTCPFHDIQKEGEKMV